MFLVQTTVCLVLYFVLDHLFSNVTVIIWRTESAESSFTLRHNLFIFSSTSSQTETTWVELSERERESKEERERM